MVRSTNKLILSSSISFIFWGFVSCCSVHKVTMPEDTTPPVLQVLYPGGAEFKSITYYDSNSLAIEKVGDFYMFYIADIPSTNYSVAIAVKNKCIKTDSKLELVLVNKTSNDITRPQTSSTSGKLFIENQGKCRAGLSCKKMMITLPGMLFRKYSDGSSVNEYALRIYGANPLIIQVEE